MKRPVFRFPISRLFCVALIAAWAGSLLGCKPKPAQADATQALQQSFQQADPALQQTIAAVNSNLKSGNYQEAGRLLEPVVTGRQLTPPQKQAVSVALQQLNQAVAANPALNTKEMYDLRNKMFQALHNGPRF